MKPPVSGAGVEAAEGELGRQGYVVVDARDALHLEGVHEEGVDFEFDREGLAEGSPAVEADGRKVPFDRRLFTRRCRLDVSLHVQVLESRLQRVEAPRA